MSPASLWKTPIPLASWPPRSSITSDSISRLSGKGTDKLMLLGDNPSMNGSYSFTFERNVTNMAERYLQRVRAGYPSRVAIRIT